ncbi:protein Rog3p [[Candida] railenensis]|uniref:Protein Rog3p n=1 Tax=[Candida] railenensis TaxID=45579 RepID=A0A9P0QN37_9ASCO|nr:protein Rog3p [[Candida] railenensis]
MLQKKHDLALFEIRLKSPHKNLLLLKGNEHECEQVPFQGSIKLSSPSDLHVKKISLRLIGEYRLDYFQRDSHGTVIDQVSEHHCVLDVEWGNLLTDAEGKIIFGDYGDSLTRMNKHHKKTNSGNNSFSSLPKSNDGSSSNLLHPSSAAPSSRPSFLRSSSQPHFGFNSSSNLSAASSSSLLQIPKSGIDGTPFKDRGATSSSSFLLPKGNYNLPFQVYLPTNISETVEGLNCGQLLYRLECNIERGRFEKAFHKTKHVRIMRTLHPQCLSLIESVDINNTWPKKVQYAVSLMKKGVAVGATVPVMILIVPLAKGLKLQGINGVLVQHYHVLTQDGRSPEFEEIYGKQDMPMPDVDSLPLDQWQVKTHFKIPTSLKKVTQTCELKNSLIQVKHRLRISIQLLNKEGHISELRANLPIHLYVSANTGHVVGHHYEADSHGNLSTVVGGEDILFRKDDPHNKNPIHQHHHHHHHEGSGSGSVSPNLTVSNTEDTSSSVDSDNELDREETAPPLYQKHIFDKIYDSSLPQTPLEQFRSQTGSPVGSSANLAGYFDSIPTSLGEAFERNLKKNGKLPGALSKTPSALDVLQLCKVPSYEYAADEDVDDQDELAPTYSNGGKDGSDSGSGSVSDLLRPNLGRSHTVDNLKLKDKKHSHSKLHFRIDRKKDS